MLLYRYIIELRRNGVWTHDGDEYESLTLADTCQAMNYTPDVETRIVEREYELKSWKVIGGD